MSEEFEVGVELMVWANITVEADSFDEAEATIKERMKTNGVQKELTKALRRGGAINDHSYHIVGIARSESKMYS